MTTPATNANPSIPSNQGSGYDPAGHQYNVLQRIANVQTDATTGEVYGDLGIDVEVNLALPANQSVNLSQVGGVATAMAGSDGQTAANVPFEVNGYYNPATGGIDRQRTPTIFKLIASQAVTAGTPVSVWTPAAGKKFRILGFTLSTSVAGSILIQDTTGVNVLRLPKQVVNGVVSTPQNFNNGYLSTAANNQLFIDVSASGNVDGMIFGTEE